MYCYALHQINQSNMTTTDGSFGIMIYRESDDTLVHLQKSFAYLKQCQAGISAEVFDFAKAIAKECDLEFTELELVSKENEFDGIIVRIKRKGPRSWKYTLIFVEGKIVFYKDKKKVVTWKKMKTFKEHFPYVLKKSEKLFKKK